MPAENPVPQYCVSLDVPADVAFICHKASMIKGYDKGNMRKGRDKGNMVKGT